MQKWGSELLRCRLRWGPDSLGRIGDGMDGVWIGPALGLGLAAYR